MSLGIFRSIRGSFVASARRHAERVILALNRELARRQMPEYIDPDPEERALRRLPCGNAGSMTFGALHTRLQAAKLPWTLGNLRGERQIALPLPFDGKISVPTGRLFFVLPTTQDFCAVRTVARELESLAPLLAIPLAGGTVTEDIADRLGDCQPMPGETPEEAGALENERSLWLDLHLACRYGLEDGTPVVIG